MFAAVLLPVVALSFSAVSAYITVHFPAGGINIREDVSSSYYGYELSALTDSALTLNWLVGTSSPAVSRVTWGFYSASGPVVMFGYAVTSSPPFNYSTAATYIVPIETTDYSTNTVTNYLRVNILPIDTAPILTTSSATVTISQRIAASTCLLANTYVTTGSGCSATYIGYDRQNSPLGYSIGGVNASIAATFFRADTSGSVLTTAAFSLSALAETYVAYVNVVNDLSPRLTSTFSLTVVASQATAKLTVVNLPTFITMYDTVAGSSLVFSFQTTSGTATVTSFTYWFSSNPLSGQGKFLVNSTGGLYTESGATFDYASEPSFELLIYTAEVGPASPQTVSNILKINVLQGTTTTTSTTTTTTTTYNELYPTVPSFWPRTAAVRLTHFGWKVTIIAFLCSLFTSNL